MYRLGEIGTGSLMQDTARWWAKIRGKEDPYQQIAEVNDRTATSTSGYTWAIQDINFDVHQGEVLGIIGRNGAGKSTLLKVLSRVTSPTTGTAKFRGRIASLLEVGTGFHKELTGKENIYLNGAILGMNRQEITKKLEEIVDFAGIERYIDTPVKRYSSGMYVRLAFAVAAHLEPEILIVDEVLAVGDAEFQKKAIGKMQEVSQGQGRTVLFVSHNIGSIAEICNRCMVLNQGIKVFDGDVEEAISQYIKSNATVGQAVHTVESSDKPNYINECKVYNNQGTETGVYDLNEDINLSIKYTLSESFNDFYVTIKVYRNGRTVFSSFDTDFKEDAYKRGNGTYVSKMTIPALFLKAGAYEVDVIIRKELLLGAKGKVLDEVGSAIRFYVEELSIDTNAKSFISEGPGDVIFSGDWDIQQVSS